jgi:hypothetical protein
MGWVCGLFLAVRVGDTHSAQQEAQCQYERFHVTYPHLSSPILGQRLEEAHVVLFRCSRSR